MALFAAIYQCLTGELLAQLAGASVLSVAATQATTAVAVPALVRQLAEPVEFDELNARWDMCHQLYLSQLLTEPEELLRTDLGWPDRRRYLAQRLLGAGQAAALAEATGQPSQAGTLLGYLTTLVLAVVGKQITTADLSPQELGSWLAGQQVPAQVPMPFGALAGAPRNQFGQSVATVAGKAKLTALPVVSGLVAAGLAGGYWWLGTSAEAALPSVPQVKVAAKAAPAPIPPPAVAPKAAAPAAPPAVVAASAALPPARAKSKPTALAAAPATGLRDTAGNAELARQVGGKFNVGAGRYLKGEGQPLIIKLVSRATLTVGINSTESLLYKRLAQPSLPRPADIAVDRLSFDLGQARLGAEGAQQLGSIASLLKTFPKVRLVVVGHANIHEAQAIRLGLQRAAVAVDELVKQGIAADRLQAQGMLSTELPSDNDSAEKQAMLQGITLKISRL